MLYVMVVYDGSGGDGCGCCLGVLHAGGWCMVVLLCAVGDGDGDEEVVVERAVYV